MNQIAWSGQQEKEEVDGRLRKGIKLLGVGARKGRGGWTNGEGGPRLKIIAKGLGLVFWIMGQV